MERAPLTPRQLLTFRHALSDWFTEHKRDLPWRRTRDPYAIWVSEIMLQQTRVAAVLAHYARWMERYPTVGVLAGADEQEVLALWSGLGYYRRARMLHAGAKAVVAKHGSVLPPSAEALRKLPGIGNYTSAAIASIAFNEPVAVVDGNVERVVTRIAGLGAEQETEKPAPKSPATMAREIRLLAHAWLAPASPGDANQAMMELGATICLPKAPLCLHCPVMRWCATRGQHVRSPRKPQQSREIAYVLIERETGAGKEILLEQRRPDVSLMAAMWELPPVDLATATAAGAEQVLTLRHAITVTNYKVSIVAASATQVAALLAPSSRTWQSISTLPEIALTGLARKVLRRLALWPNGGGQPGPVVTAPCASICEDSTRRNPS